MVVLSLSPPAANASYTLKVRGPFLQCNPANSSQVPYFEDYKESLLEGPFLVTSSNWNTPVKPTFPFGGYAGMLMFSAFDPSLGGAQGWLGESYYDLAHGNSPDEFNTWAVDFPVNASGYYVEGNDPELADVQVVPRQIWIQTSNESIVCTMGNATRDVNFGFMEGTQTIAYGDLEDFEPVFVPRMGDHLKVNITAEQYTYVAAYWAMTSMISGNASIELIANETGNSSYIIVTDSSYTVLRDSSSRSLVTGLVACDEFVHSFWQEHPIVGNSDPDIKYCNSSNGAIRGNGSIQSTCPRTPQNWTGPPIGQLEPPEAVTNTLFNYPAWMCRNRTLARAIEDLATNITLSMMSAPDLM